MVSETAIPETDAGEDSIDQPADDASPASSIRELLSWTIGVAFDRFDVHLATHEKPIPPEPEPFDPLPVCSLGMISGEDGLPLSAPPLDYLIDFPSHGVLIDDEGHAHHIFDRVSKVFRVVFGADADTRLEEAAELLDPRERDLRRWLACSFWDGHIRRYSKSRRRAPIYWQLSIPSLRYSVWLYYHRFTSDTLYTMAEFVRQKREHEETRLIQLRQEASSNPTRSQAREIEEQEHFVEELRAFHQEVVRVAPIWKPDLNDGVLINFTPLWRLVPHHPQWQRECRECWEKLVAGEYDWAHLAMHLWPERVVPKCATDRSLAIAHGLEEVFWHEDEDGKWKRRDVPVKPVEELIAERTSPAVKAALEDLLAAPEPAGRGHGRRR